MAGSPGRSEPSSRQLRFGRIATPSSRSSTDDHVLVGRIVKPHGLRGEVLVKVLSENPTRFHPGAHLLVGKDPGSAETLEVAESRVEGGRLLVRFAEFSRVESAEGLRDLLVFVDKEALRELSEDEYWTHDLVGLTVVDPGGNVLGTLDEVIDRPAQDLWSIRTPKGNVLFPAAKPLVRSVDLGEGRIVVDPPSGLFE